MDTTINPYWRYPHVEGYASGYRIPRELDRQLKLLSQQTGLSKLHLLEIALRQFTEKTHPLEW